MENIVDLKNQEFCFLGQKGKFTGHFQFYGNTFIESTLEGTIELTSPFNLQIGQRGKIQGKIHCHHLEIKGCFEGEIEASGIVVIFPSSTVTGKIKAQNLVIHPGSIVNINGKTQNN